MKKFQFTLQSVMDFKSQRLEIEKNEHAKALAKVNEQERKIQDLRDQFNDLTRRFEDKKNAGFAIVEANLFMMALDTTTKEIERQGVVLSQLQKIEEERREIVVATKIEASSLEKIKEKKYEEYLNIEKKSDELFIEEFVSRQKICSN